MLDQDPTKAGLPNVLLLGISYACVESQIEKRGFTPDILTYKEPSVEQAVECVGRNILTEMDARDLARCVATEQATETDVYTVSKENGAVYRSDRHVHADFNARNFCQALKDQFGPNIQFSQVILDYYWMPTGWLVTRWRKTLFQQTLPDLVRNQMLTIPSRRKKRGSSFEEGVVYLPFCAHVCKELVGAIHVLQNYYAVTFVHKKDLPGHSLWKGTMSIDGHVMQTRLGKRLDQEEVYCTFRPKDIYESMEDAHVSKPAVMKVLLAIENYDDIRMIKLRPLRQHEKASVFRERLFKNEVGGFIGLNYNLASQKSKKKPTDSSSAVKQPVQPTEGDIMIDRGISLAEHSETDDNQCEYLTCTSQNPKGVKDCLSGEAQYPSCADPWGPSCISPSRVGGLVGLNNNHSKKDSQLQQTVPRSAAKGPMQPASCTEPKAKEAEKPDEMPPQRDSKHCASPKATDMTSDNPPAYKERTKSPVKPQTSGSKESNSKEPAKPAPSTPRTVEPVYCNVEESDGSYFPGPPNANSESKKRSPEDNESPVKPQNSDSKKSNRKEPSNPAPSTRRNVEPVYFDVEEPDPDMLKKFCSFPRPANANSKSKKRTPEDDEMPPSFKKFRHTFTDTSMVEGIIPALAASLILQPIDILSARGNGAKTHPGNKCFQEIIQRKCANYSAAKAPQRKKIAERVYDTLRSGGSRFLKQNENSELIEMPEKDAKRKVTKALSQANA